MIQSPNPTIRRLLLRMLRVQVQGADMLSEALEQGRVLIAANHVSYLDGVIIALASPSPLLFPVDTTFSRDSFLASRFLNMLQRFGWGEVVPMDSANPAALKTLKRRLDQGANVLIFPEGQISCDGRPTAEMPGTQWLASKTGARRLHLQIEGAQNSRLFGKSGREVWPAITLNFYVASRAGSALARTQAKASTQFSVA